MSTRSGIGVQRADGKIEAIYCHFDGYLDGVGVCLKDFYKDQKKVDELIDLGDISSLEDTIENCDAYHRDHHEPKTNPRVFKSIDDYEKNGFDRLDADYIYLYKDGKWSAKNMYGKTWINELFFNEDEDEE